MAMEPRRPDPQRQRNGPCQIADIEVVAPRIQRAELQLDLTNDIVTLRYFDHAFPLAPGSLPSLGAPAEAGLRDLNANPGALDDVIRRQHYRLVHWRRGDSELNYRRFFGIPTLAGVCVEHPTS